jgi:outer membrane protein OmpA-like peptidoglycan-associated protein/tetratricopeptide (TPR) repeat protein/ribosomal protein L24E
MNKSIFLLLATLIIYGQSYSQAVTYEHARKKAQNHFDAGNNLYAFGHYVQADSLLKLAIESEKNFIDAHWLLGNMYLDDMRKFDDAVTELKIVEQLNPHFSDLLFLKIGYALFNKGDYDEAKKYFHSFIEVKGVTPDYEREAKSMIKNCDFAKEAVKHPVPFKPINLGSGVNSPEDDLMPALTADEKYLYFTRLERIGRFHDENIFVSENRNGQWLEAQPLGETINTLQYNEGAHCISPSGKYLFFTSCDRPGSYGGCDIYFSKKTGGEWEPGKNLGPVINTGAKETQPYISGDGRTLYFVSSKAGGFGGGDIYSSELGDDGQWGTPKNLGPNINTEFEEERPFIHPDGQTLYFTSRGHVGMGGADLFMSHKQPDGTWGEAINLGYPINTPGDEIGIYVTGDGKWAYFASEQPDTKGGMDIYKFEMPDNIKPFPVSYVKGTVTDKANGSALNTRIQFFDLGSGALYSSASSDPKSGEYLATLPTGKNYACQITKEGYLFYSANFSLEKEKEGLPYTMDIQLQKIQVGSAVVLNNVFFESNSYELKNDSKTELNTLIQLLTKNPSLKIEIGGHTDNSGIEKDNEGLSQNRAKSVYDFLITKGIAAGRLSYKGYAATKPIGENKTAEGKAKNRRTEFIVTGI